MGMIISVIIMGSLFIAYEIIRNNRQGKDFRSCADQEYDTPRVITLPENIEREKRKRHIH